MGLILDSSVVIAAERRGDTVEQLIEKIVKATGDQEAALSAIGLTELIHGLYRAQTPEIRQRRESSGAVSKHKILGSDSDEYSAFAWAPNGKRLAYIKPAKDGKGGNSATHGFSIPGSLLAGFMRTYGKSRPIRERENPPANRFS